MSFNEFPDPDYRWEYAVPWVQLKRIKESAEAMLLKMQDGAVNQEDLRQAFLTIQRYCNPTVYSPHQYIFLWKAVPPAGIGEVDFAGYPLTYTPLLAGEAPVDMMQEWGCYLLFTETSDEPKLAEYWRSQGWRVEFFAQAPVPLWFSNE